MTVKRLIEKIRSINWVFPIFLVPLVYILDVRYFSSPPLYADDWSTLIWGYISGELNFADWSLTRPFVLAPFSMLTPILGIKIQYFYLINFLTIFLSAIILYLIIRRAFPKFSWLPLPVVLVYLIYPVDYTRTWLIMIIVHSAWLIDLGVILLLMDFTKSGRIWQLLLALLLFFLAQGVYEGGLGVVMLSAILLAGITRNISIKRRMAILSVLLASGVFIIWRTFIQHSLINIHDKYYTQLDTSVVTILYRYIKGLSIFIFNWTGPLSGSFGRTKFMIFVIVGIILIGISLTFLPRLIRLAKSNASFDWVDRIGMIKSLLIIFLVGGLFWAAGFVPVISFSGTTSSGVTTRYNLFAIAGASLSLVAGLSCLFTLAAKSIDRVRVMIMAAIIPFLILGLFFQSWSQNERFKAWGEQKQFWSLIFETIPGLKDNSEVIIVIPGYTQTQLRQFQLLPFPGDFEARSALKVLYNNPTLEARYYYLDRPHEGVNILDSNLEWSKILFVYYDPTKPSLEILKRPEDTLSLSFQITGYDPGNRIVNQSSKSLSYRWLVK